MQGRPDRSGAGGSSDAGDLARVNGQLVIGGPPECPTRPFCLLGLQLTYGLRFRDFKPLDASGPLTVAALESGQVDVAELFTTDPAIEVKGFVLLADDRHFQPEPRPDAGSEGARRRANGLAIHARGDAGPGPALRARGDAGARAHRAWYKRHGGPERSLAARRTPHDRPDPGGAP
jgi:hypothetical protein